MKKRKSWKPPAICREFISALAPAIHGVRPQTDRCRLLIFCGAGFAKAWSINSPLARELFSIPTDAFQGHESIYRLLEHLQQDTRGTLDQPAMKEVATFLDLCEHHPFLQGDLMDYYSAARLRADLGRAIKNHYRRIHYINDLTESKDLLPVKSKKSQHRRPIIRLLQEMMHDRCEYTEGNLGLDLSLVTTNYDYAIESWIQESVGRPVWEEVHRGFTPTQINGQENTKLLIDAPFSLKLLKLNGGFEIIEDHSGYAIDYRNHQKTPVMILPSSLQDYRSQYFQCVLEKAATAFRNADVVLFIGYSFPLEDILIRRLVAMAADSIVPGNVKHIFSISKTGSLSIKENLVKTLGSNTDDWLQLYIRNCDFARFCGGCAYWYNKARQGML